MLALSSAAVLPCVPSPALSRMPDQLPAADRRLIELAARILTIQPEYQAALDQEVVAWDAFNAKEIKPPAALKWRVGDPVGHQLEMIGSSEFRLCNGQAVERLKGKPLVKWEFIGTDEQWQHAPAWEDENPPVETAHLWKSVPDANRQARADELIEALDRWRNQQDALSRECGVTASEERAADLLRQIRTLADEMMPLRATTIEGLRAKALVVFKWCWESDTRDQLSDTTDNRFLLSMIEDLVAA